MILEQHSEMCPHKSSPSQCNKLHVLLYCLHVVPLLLLQLTSLGAQLGVTQEGEAVVAAVAEEEGELVRVSLVDEEAVPVVEEEEAMAEGHQM
jgi:hypothetical protein